MELRDIGKLLIWTGAGMASVGGCLWAGSRLLGGRRLPGDFLLERGSLRVYVPLGTCLVVSLVLSALMWLVNRWR